MEWLKHLHGLTSESKNQVCTNYKKVRAYANEAIVVFIGQGFALIGTLFFLRTVTRLLEPEQFGVLSYVLTGTGLFSLVIFGGVNNGITRYLPVAIEDDALKSYISYGKFLYKILTCVSIAIGVVLSLVMYFYSGDFNLALIILFVTFYGITNSIVNVLNGVNNAMRKRGRVALCLSIDAWLKSMLVIFASYILGAAPLVVLVSLVASGLAVIEINRRTNKELSINDQDIGENSINWNTRVLSYSWPFVVWGLFGWVQQSSSRWALDLYSNKADIAMFGVLTQLGYAPAISVGSLVMAFIVPIIFQKAGDATDSNRIKVVKESTINICTLGLTLTLIAALIAYSFSTEIVELVVDKRYLGAHSMLPIAVLAGGVFSVAQILSTYSYATMKTIKMLPVSIGSSIVGICSAYLLTSFLGLLGATLSLLLHSLAYLIFGIIQSKKC